MSSTEQVRIRRVMPSDGATVTGLMTQLAEFGHGSVAEGVAERLSVMLGRPDQAVFVAEQVDGQVVGLLTVSQRLTLWHAGPVALIEELIVDRTVRGKGVGRKLIASALEWARSRGCSELEVSTELDNQAAQAFYQRVGFAKGALLLEYDLEV